MVATNSNKFSQVVFKCYERKVSFFYPIKHDPPPKAIFKSGLFRFSNTNNKNGQMYCDAWIGMVYMKT